MLLALPGLPFTGFLLSCVFNSQMVCFSAFLSQIWHDLLLFKGSVHTGGPSFLCAFGMNMMLFMFNRQSWGLFHPLVGVQEMPQLVHSPWIALSGLITTIGVRILQTIHRMLSPISS